VRILSHYFIARFLGLFATALIATLILLATIELVLNLDDLSSLYSSSQPPRSSPDTTGSIASSSGAAAALHLLWVRLASYYLRDLLPIASFTAAFITFAWAGRAMELVAIQAGGIRLARVVIPVLGAALILSLASAILHETVILRAEQAWNARVRGEGEEIDYGRQAFWYHKGRTITNITKADAGTRTLFGVEIFERTEAGTIARVVRAERVHIDESGLWQIKDGRIWTFDPDNADAPPRLNENVEIALDLDAVRGDALLGAEPGLLPLPTLARYLDAQADVSSSNYRRLRNRYHARLTQPWLVFVFAFLALPFGLQVDQTGRIMRPAIGAAGVLGLFFFFRSAGMTLAQQEVLPIGFAPWLSMGLFVLLTAFSLRARTL
jgi:lipopolysaccharide export system permease protein